ncbi:ribosomal subunit interface protein [Candidatus Saccharibacteria bacterium]|nr:MAG: ribosomal subunit interface protein [Candidatus Saccharibacteria bacterium]
MIEPINMVGIKLDLDDDIKRYVSKKIGRLDRYLPRHARITAHAEVRLRDAKMNHGNRYECEVVLHLPGESITARDSTLNMFAAIDIVEQKLKNQLKRYKDIRIDRREKAAGLLGRMKQSLGRRPEPADEPIEI